MQSETAAQGKVLESHNYDNVRRGLTSTRANGVDQIIVTYPILYPQVATIQDSNSNSTSYGVQRVGTRSLVSSIAGSGCDSCGGRGNYSFSYDSPRKPLTNTHPLWYLCKISYSAHRHLAPTKIP